MNAAYILLAPDSQFTYDQGVGDCSIDSNK